MKKQLFIITGLLIGLSLTGCPKAGPEVENSFGYTVELNIQNKSSVSVSAGFEAYTLYDEENIAVKLYDYNPVIIDSGCEKTYNFNVQQALCFAPHLSHIFKISEKIFSGFDTNTIKIQSEDSATSFSISSLKINLGSIDWTQTQLPVLMYDGKTFNLPDKNTQAKIIYNVIIKNKSDITESEKNDYTEGIKISVDYSF